MNHFVDPKKRGVSLPAGCKDLIDVVKQEPSSHHFKAVVTLGGLLITGRLPDWRSEEEVEIIVEQNTIRIGCKKADCPTPIEDVIEVPVRYDVNYAHAVYFNGALSIIIPKL